MELGQRFTQAIALHGSGAEAMPEFAGTPTMFGPTDMELAGRASQTGIGF